MEAQDTEEQPTPKVNLKTFNQFVNALSSNP